MSQPARANLRGLVPMLVWVPAASVLIFAVLYAIASPQLPERIIRHVGPDGLGYGSPFVFFLAVMTIAIALFSIGAGLTLGSLRRGYWFGMEKLISVAVLGGGYAVLAVGCTTVTVAMGVSTEELTSQMVGAAMLGFVLTYIAAVTIYAKVLPRAKSEADPRYWTYG